MQTLKTIYNVSDILQALLTLLIWGVIGYLVIVGQSVPELLQAAGTTILGFYFGSRTQPLANNNAVNAYGGRHNGS